MSQRAQAKNVFVACCQHDATRPKATRGRGVRVCVQGLQTEKRFSDGKLEECAFCRSFSLFFEALCRKFFALGGGPTRQSSAIVPQQALALFSRAFSPLADIRFAATQCACWCSLRLLLALPTSALPFRSPLDVPHVSPSTRLSPTRAHRQQFALKTSHRPPQLPHNPLIFQNCFKQHNRFIKSPLFHKYCRQHCTPSHRISLVPSR